MTSAIDASLVNGKEGSDSVLRFSSNSSKSQNNNSMVVHEDAFFYKMDHPQRGLAVIFNHEKFLIPYLRKRSGTQVDCDNLKKCWEKIGFTTKVYQDLCYKDLRKAIDKIAEIDYSKMDCLVICVLSHGGEGVIYARDKSYKHKKLWQKFTAIKCKSLAGKPKLFFIQACQGSRLDSGIKLASEVDGSHSYKIPVHADFLIAYSTIPDFYSWRGDARGAWFIQALCSELEKNSFAYDLLTLLTLINRRVAIDFESIYPEMEHLDGKKEMPNFLSTLTCLVQFRTNSS